MPIPSDLRFVIRGLRRRPAFSAAVVLTLALGIGANAAMVGLVDRLLLSAPPHVRDADRVVRMGIEFGAPDDRYTMSTTSYPVFADIRDQTRAFESVAAVSSGQTIVLGRGADARAIPAAKASGSYFAMLGARPLLGRFFGQSDDRPPVGSPVVVVSHAFWRRELGGERSVLGREILLDGASYAVIGVAPAGFTGDGLEPSDVWLPLHAAMSAHDGGWRTDRGRNVVSIVGKLRDGASRLLAEQEATAALRNGSEEAGHADSTSLVRLASLAPGLGSERATTQSRIALWLAGVSVIVFVIAAANVLNLMLLRGVQRRREVAVRLALGAGRRRIVAALALESFVLAALGGALALAVAGWGSEAVRILLMPGIAPSERLVSPRIFLVAAFGVVISTLVTGLIPALRASRPSLIGDLSEGGGGAVGRRKSPLLGAMLLVQSALSVLLLVGAGLFVASLHRVRTQDFGFSAENVLYATLEFAGSVPAPTQDALYRQAEAEVRRLPGVELATIVQSVPFGPHNVPPIAVPGRPDFPDPTKQLPFLNAASPDYFRLMRMRLLRGRGFTEADRAGAPLVVVINQSMARGLWGEENAIGKCIRVGVVPGLDPTPQASPMLPCREVVGVVNDARRRSVRDELGQARMQYYIPFGQLPDGAAPFPVSDASGLLVRTSGLPETSAAVRRAMQSFAPNLPLAEVRPLREMIERNMRPWILGAAMFSVFGALALLLAAIGLYGVRAYSVSQRTREMGVRIALGARGPDLVGLIVAEGVRITGIGVALGVLAALAAGGFVEPLLFETSAREPLILAGVALTLLVVAVLASALPAWRAARIEPSVALRAD